MSVVFVPGTHSWDGKKDEWYTSGSPLITYLERHGLVRADDTNPFVWSTGLGGVGFGRRDLVVWKAAGLNLYRYVYAPRCPSIRIPPEETVVVSHSHGLQVVLFACGNYGLKIHTLVDISGPVRKDMRDVAERARPNIANWTHIYGGQRDVWQWLGELFDGHLGIVREHPLADTNKCIPNANHGDVVRNPDFFPYLVQALGLSPEPTA